MAKGVETRNRIMDVAQASILVKGFDATSIEEIVANAAITKSGFFYHFRDKNALARALIERYIEDEDELLDGVFARAWDLADDPLQRALIVLRLFAEMLADLPNGHPGCLVATATYQDRLFDQDVHAANRKAVLGWRARFRRLFDEVAASHPIKDAVDLDDLADMVTAVVDGGIVLSRATGDPKATSRQVLLVRSYVKQLFG